MNRPLPPTTPSLLEPEARPYFLWWLDCTVREFREHLASSEPGRAGYYFGALLREANSRDIWLFTTPDELRRRWPDYARYLGPSRAKWAWLLEIPGEQSEHAR